MPYNNTVTQTKMTKTKTRRVSVTPLSRKAKNRFANEMNSFHTCTVEGQREMADGSQWLFLSITNVTFLGKCKDNNNLKVER